MREELKARKMGRLEAAIAAFLTEYDIKHHRQWPIKLGTSGRKQKRYAVSFYLPEHGLILDMTDMSTDMSLYNAERHVDVMWNRFKDARPLYAIIPVNKYQRGKTVKKQLEMLVLK